MGQVKPVDEVRVSACVTTNKLFANTDLVSPGIGIVPSSWFCISFSVYWHQRISESLEVVHQFQKPRSVLI